MLNNRPIASNTYSQGLYIPVNKDKVVKLNSQGGLFYRSSWEKKIMIWLDSNPSIMKWMAEGIEIPYFSKEVVNGELENIKRRYYPDFYYKIKKSDGSIEEVIAEVKPKKEVDNVVMFKEGKFIIPPKISTKKMKNLEYDFKMAQKNSSKWDSMIEWCKSKGMKFIIITEEHLTHLKS